MANEPPVKGLPVLDCSPGVNRKLYKVSSKPRIRHANHVDSESETEGSDDSISINSSQTEANKKALQPPGTAYKSSPSKHRKRHKSRQEWEIIEGLKDTQRCEEKPDKYQGFLMKRRRWPMKGWHKRFFVLEKGILYYAKSASDIQKGKYHGIIDTGLSVLAFKSHRHRIDIDAEDIIYHIKVKEKIVFEEWLKRLRHHRLYRQHEIAYGTKESPRLTEITSPTEDMNVRFSQTLNFTDAQESTLRSSSEIIRQSSFKSQNTSQGRVAAWLLDTAGFEHCNKELMETQKLLCDLYEDLEFIRSLPLSSDSEAKENDLIDCKKKSKGLVLRSSKRKDKKSDSSMNSDNQVPTTQVISAPASPGITASQVNMRTSSSNPNLVLYEQERVTRPQSVPDYVTMSTQEQKLRNIKVREEFLSKAETVHRNLKSLLHTMSTERERLKSAIEVDNSLMTPGTTVAALRNNLAEVCRQNEEMRSRLARIHLESMPYPEQKIKPQSPILSPNQREHFDLSKSVSQTLSVESCSMSEYYDAEEENKDSGSESSTEASDEEEISDEISEENDTDYNAAQSVSEDQLSVSFETGRRSQLPVPKPDTGDVSLWNILYKNIGKDLTKISMPVTLNEPLSMLQRLCEELEYSELIDKAAEQEDPYVRMMYIAAFAVSGYASSGYRAGHKPFNPILGETYECVREDKGWKFVSEQVSHHPPISACFCESKSFTLWQDTRIKTKFWGKSMEIQPIGLVHLKLPKYKDHYEWNKVTTCVHNILGGQRWVDQYGEMHIRNGNISCKLTFKKASQWSSKRHEVYGQILNPEKKVMHSLFGKWNEALYCGHAPSAKCIWRPGAMPDDFELYYGFTRFAIELNELDKEETKHLPPTDTRFRPDQRLLEEGKIQESENEKQRVEQLQREYRKKREEEKSEYQSLWFKKYSDGSKETYMYTGKYWDLKKDPGFNKIPFTKIW